MMREYKNTGLKLSPIDSVMESLGGMICRLNLPEIDTEHCGADFMDCLLSALSLIRVICLYVESLPDSRVEFDDALRGNQTITHFFSVC